MSYAITAEGGEADGEEMAVKFAEQRARMKRD
jgi:hypothetical protein